MKRALATACAAALAFAASASGSSPERTRTEDTRPVSKAPIAATPMPQRFVEEQADEALGPLWAVHGQGRSVFVAAREARIVQRSGSKGHVVAMELAGARDDARIEATETEATLVNRLQGPRAQWRTGLRTARTLVTGGVWPGIDVRWETGDSRAKYAFAVEPGADASQIRLRWRGADGVKAAASGDLVVTTPLGEIRDARP